MGYKNIDGTRIEHARQAGATEVKVRGFSAYRLPIDIRRRRVAMVVKAIGSLEGGAKQTLHLTDTSPAVLVLAVCRHGNQPFQRVFGSGDPTAFRDDVLAEALRVFGQDLQSAVYVGWATGFLDAERKKLLDFVEQRGDMMPRIHMGHPREMAEEFAQTLENPGNESWFD